MNTEVERRRSSVGRENIPKEQTIALLDSNIFDGHEEKRFALASLSSEQVLTDAHTPDTLANAYLRLRANVYVDQTEMLDSERKSGDGTELDEYDERSTHFLVIENKLGMSAVFACMRLINKSSEDNLLPVENDFKEYFKAHPAEPGSVEVSRYMARSNSLRTNLNAERNMINAGLASVVDNEGGIYAMVEPMFESTINRILHIPTKRVADPEFIEEYNDCNVGIEIDKKGIEQKLGHDVIMAYKNLNEEPFYWGNTTYGEK